MKQAKKAAWVRTVAYGGLGFVFLYTAWGMPAGLPQTVWFIIGVLDMVFAAWCAAKLFRS